MVGPFNGKYEGVITFEKKPWEVGINFLHKFSDLTMKMDKYKFVTKVNQEGYSLLTKYSRGVLTFDKY